MSEAQAVFYEGFIIDSDSKAEWALKVIREAREDCDRMVDWYKQKTKEVKEETEFRTMNLERQLMDYFATVPHKKTKTQESYSLPGGKLVMKKQQPEFKRDDATVIDWLKQNGGKFVKVKEELDWSGLKETVAAFEGHVITEDGEIVPGIEVVERENKFVVEV